MQVTQPTIFVLWDDSHIWGLMVWRALRALGLPSRLVKGKDIANGGLLGKPLEGGRAAPLLMVPGGNARLKAQALGEAGREAVRRGHTIAVAATFPCSIAPTRRTLERAAREAGRRIEVREVVIDGGFGMEEEEFKRLLAERISAEASDADVVIFTQGSMAYVSESVSRALGVPVLANPVFSAQAVAEALAAKGVVAER